MFTFTPLLGAQTQSIASQSLLELDGGIKVLVDVGWDSGFDAKALHALEKHVSTLSFVLLTHPTIDHIGAYAHCCKHVPLFNKIPVYATTPVINLGRTLLSDLYASAPLITSIIPQSSILTTTAPSEASLNLLQQCPTTEEIATYFSAINPLKYSQPHQPIPSSFSPPLGNLTITAYSAGHTPGGTIWHIQHGLESIIYAVDWNQGRENLLAGAAWLGGAGAEIIEPLRRPTALVCSSRGVERTDTLPRKKRDEMLVSVVRDTVAQGGKVLIPTDSSARVLELAFILNHTWRENIGGPHDETFKNAKIYMASRTSTSTIRQLPSMLEWMDESIIRDAEAAMNKDKGDEKVPNLLEWRFVKQIERQSQFERALKRSHPSVLLASDSSLEWGFSRLALRNFAEDPRNLVILTETVSESGSEANSLAKQLRKSYSDAIRVGNQTGAKVVTLSEQHVEFREAVPQPLTAEEDVIYQQCTARQRQIISNAQGDSVANDVTMTEIADDQASDDSESEDENEDPDHQGRALNASAQMTQSNKRKVGLSEAELGINVLLRSKHVHDFDVRNKRGREKVFPFIAHRHKNDDFGDIIKPEEYLRAEERDDVEGVDLKPGTNSDSAAPGLKRKWDENAGQGVKKKRPQKEATSKPTKEREPDDIDALIARATGEGAEADADSNSEAESESDYEPEDAAEQAPRKLVFKSLPLTLNIKIAHIDFTAIHEKRDLQMLIPLIQPRKLILISGTESETQTLASECKQLFRAGSAQVDVFTPAIGETVNASVDTNAWSLKLSRALVRKLTWQNVKGLGIVALTGRLDVEVVDDAPEALLQHTKKKARLTKGEDENGDTKDQDDHRLSIPVLDLVNASAAVSGTSHQRATQPVHVGDLRIADLRRLMLASGHTAEFRGEGTLLIDSTVIVRKSASGKIEVEAGAGGLSQPLYRTKEMEGSFFAVRKLIYEGLAVVQGV